MKKVMKLLSVCLLLVLLTACNDIDAPSNPNSQGDGQNVSGSSDSFPDVQSNPDTMIEAYISGFLSSDYAEFSQYILYAGSSENSEDYEFNIEGWNTIDVKSAELKDKDIRETRGYYTIEIEFNDVGKSSFEKSLRAYYASVEKKEDGKWYVVSLTAAYPPDEEWLALEK